MKRILNKTENHTVCNVVHQPVNQQVLADAGNVECLALDYVQLISTL